MVRGTRTMAVKINNWLSAFGGQLFFGHHHTRKSGYRIS